MTTVNTTNIQVVSGASIAGMDLETAMATVQSERTRLIEGQLKSQLDSAATRNENISAMDEELNTKRTQLGNLEASGASTAKLTELTAMRDQLTQVKDRDPNGWTGMSWGWAGDD